MRRISNTEELFEAEKQETIRLTIEAKKTPHSITFADEGPEWEVEVAPPPVEVRTFQMGGVKVELGITYSFPPPALRDPDAHYLITWQGKGATSDGPTRLDPLPFANQLSQSYEFRPAAAAVTKKKAVAKKKVAKRAPRKGQR